MYTTTTTANIQSLIVRLQSTGLKIAIEASDYLRSLVDERDQLKLYETLASEKIEEIRQLKLQNSNQSNTISELSNQLRDVKKIINQSDEATINQYKLQLDAENATIKSQSNLIAVQKTKIEELIKSRDMFEKRMTEVDMLIRKPFEVPLARHDTEGTTIAGLFTCDCPDCVMTRTVQSGSKAAASERDDCPCPDCLARRASAREAISRARIAAARENRAWINASAGKPYIDSSLKNLGHF